MWFVCGDDAWGERLASVGNTLTSAETFEGNTHLAAMSLTDVVERFWAPAEGWRTISIESVPFYACFLFEHPTEGIGACLIGATPPGEVGRPAAPGSATTWEALDVAMRARNIFVSYHARAATRLDLLRLVRETDGGTVSIHSSTQSMLTFLLGSPVFMDAATRTLEALGSTFQCADTTTTLT